MKHFAFWLPRFILIFLGYVPSLLHGQERFLIDRLDEMFYLKTKVEWIAQDSMDPSISEVQGFRFEPGSSQPELLDPGKKYWGRIRLENKLGYPSRWVFSPDWGYDIENNGKVFLYLIEEAKTLTAGRYIAASQRQLNTGLENQFYLEFEPGETKTLYWQFYQIEGKYPVLNPVLLEYAYWKGLKKDGRNITQAIFQGIVWIILLYSLFTFWGTGDRSYLFYVLFLLSTSIYMLYLTGIFSEVFLSEVPWLNLYFWILFSNLLVIGYFQFSRNYMRLHEISPKWDKIVKNVVWGIVFLMFLELLICYLSFNEYVLNHMINITLLVEIVFLIVVIAILSSRNKEKIDRVAVNFIVGSCMLILGGTVSIILDMLGLLRNNIIILETAFVGQILTFSLGLGYRMYNLKKRHLLEQNEKEKLKELDEVKSKFFANISHDFRTPLTVITANTRQLLAASDQQTSKSQQSLNAIKRNGGYLLNLVNQVLDLASLDQHMLKPAYQQGNIVEYLRKIAGLLSSYADDQEIQLEFKTEQASIPMDFDPERMRSIVTNLLSNALKFTPQGGLVSLSVQTESLSPAGKDQPENFLKMMVSDTGIGIEPNKLGRIFDRFYQTEEQMNSGSMGTGIGLALVKEEVALLGGRIEVDSIKDQGTSFYVWIPITNNAPWVEEDPDMVSDSVSLPLIMEEELDMEMKHSPDAMKKELVLLIEDNLEVASLIIADLKDRYRIIHAKNGDEGLTIAFDQIPDLIISDVMMPGKNGYEVCEIIKSRELTCHIPVMLLTAKGGGTDRIEGLNLGADAYLAKPYDPEELNVRSKKLIELRKTLQEYYRKISPEQIRQQTEERRPDDAFLNKLHQILEDHLDNPELNPALICDEMNMSHSQVYRKLRALTDKSIQIYIRYYRLHRAKYLIIHSHDPISSIAYSVGFSDPAYFSRAFTKEFGQSPRSMRNV